MILPFFKIANLFNTSFIRTTTSFGSTSISRGS